MAAPFLPPSTTPLTLEVITAQAGILLLKARAVAEQVACPKCGTRSQRVHSHYQRRLMDLPWQGQGVRIELTVRKLFCDNPECPGRIFTEPLPGIARRYARKTHRLAEALLELAQYAGGEAAARIARTFGLLVSPDTLLDALHKTPASRPPTPRVLGVDDFAFRRGHTYGTLLIDQERRCPIDLLPDRDSKTVEAWLCEHPGIQIVTRDRAQSYKDAIDRGAPDALQVADRFHLLQNQSQALERLAQRHHVHLREATRVVQKASAPPNIFEQDPTTPASKPSPAWLADKASRREGRQARFEEVKQLQAEGLSLREVARRTGLSRNTILKLARCDTLPEVAGRVARSGKLAPFAAHLKHRFAQGERNATRLHQEIVVQGFTGSVNVVQRFLAPRREKPRVRAGPNQPGPLSPRRASCLLSAEHHCLRRDEDVALLEALLSACPQLSVARDLALEFGRLVRERDVVGFQAWRERVKASGVAELAGFAAGLEQDLSAVEAALSVEWSNGPVEGQVNRLKFIKRSMYGRGSFALLRARVLHRAAA
jgi:transposase